MFLSSQELLHRCLMLLKEGQPPWLVIDEEVESYGQQGDILAM